MFSARREVCTVNRSVDSVSVGELVGIPVYVGSGDGSDVGLCGRGVGILEGVDVGLVGDADGL